MEFQEIIYDKKDTVAKITLNRPSVLNALSPLLVQELRDATKDAAADETVKVVVVTGAGRAFSAGVDLNSLNDSIKGGQFDADDILNFGNEFIETLQTMPKPSIAMVNGHCFTGALELMLAFDLIIAADEAKIGDTHTKWGIAPKWGMSQRLAQKVGLLKAMEISFTAKPVLGKEAERIGLVNKSVPSEQLEAATQEMVEMILGNSSQTIAAMKTLYYHGTNHTLAEGIKFESDSVFTINDREEFLRDFENNKGFKK